MAEGRDRTVPSPLSSAVCAVSSSGCWGPGGLSGAPGPPMGSASLGDALVALGEGAAAGLVFNSQDAPRGPGCGCHEDEAPVTFSEGGGQAV